MSFSDLLHFIWSSLGPFMILQISHSFYGWLIGVHPPANAGDTGSLPGLGRASGEWNGSCLGNLMDRGALWATVHGVARVGHNLVTKLPPLYIDYIFLNHSSIVGFFHVLTIVNSATMNIGMHVPFQIRVFIFPRYISRSGILDHMVALFLVFLRSLHTVFHGLPHWLSSKVAACNVWSHQFDP